MDTASKWHLSFGDLSSKEDIIRNKTFFLKFEIGSIEFDAYDAVIV